MYKLKFPRFLSGGIQTDVDQDEVLLDNYMTRTLSYLLGYISSEDEFKFIETNNLGQMNVNNHFLNAIPRWYKTGTIPGFFTSLLSDNPKVYKINISNYGDYPATIQLISDNSIPDGFVLPEKQMIEIWYYNKSIKVGDLGTQTFVSALTWEYQ